MICTFLVTMPALRPSVIWPIRRPLGSLLECTEIGIPSRVAAPNSAFQTSSGTRLAGLLPLVDPATPCRA